MCFTRSEPQPTAATVSPGPRLSHCLHAVPATHIDINRIFLTLDLILKMHSEYLCTVRSKGPLIAKQLYSTIDIEHSVYSDAECVTCGGQWTDRRLYKLSLQPLQITS